MSDDVLAHSVGRHLFWVGIMALVLVGGVGVWASLLKISGAVIATGNVVVETNTKQVQHQEGGIIKEIHVRNGDIVQAGDLLLRLNNTVSQANLSIIINQLSELYAQEARLLAEQDGRAEITFRPDDKRLVGEQEARIIQDSQHHLFIARRNSLRGRKEQLQEQIVQFEQQIEGLIAQKTAKGKETLLIKDELKGLETLLEKELVSATRVTALRRDEARLEGEHGGLVAQIAQVKEAISERKIQILQIEEEARAEVLQQLQDTRSKIAQLEEQRVTAEDQLTRVEIRAPRSGYVHNLVVHTIGGVISPAAPIMAIVPQEDQLVIEAQVQPVDISQLSTDQVARVRLPSFNQRTTPELSAKLKTISADLLQDETSGMSYYQVRLTISDEELSKLNGKELLPGMPVEVFIKTEERSVLSYLVKPIKDQIVHAMKER